MNQINQAFIFAAGRGERMRPITDEIPKPLIKVNNKSIIDYSIDFLEDISSIKRIIVNGFYLADLVNKHIESKKSKKLVFSHEHQKIETGGGLLYAIKKHLVDVNEPILLINGDILCCDKIFFEDIQNLIKLYFESGCDIVLGLKRVGQLYGYEGFGDFTLEIESKKVYKLDHDNSHVFVGLQIVNPMIFKDIDIESFSMNYFYKKALNSKKYLEKICAEELRAKYYHIGDVKTLGEVEKIISQLINKND